MKGGTLIFLGVLLLLGVVGYYVMRSQGGYQAQEVTSTPTGEEQKAMPVTGTEGGSVEAQTNKMQDQSTSKALAAQSNAKEFTLENKGMSYTVKEMRVKKGETVSVTFKVVGGNHDWNLDEFDAHTKVMATGGVETVEFVADKVGEFEYYCSVPGHRAAGMVGKFIVEE